MCHTRTPQLTRRCTATLHCSEYAYERTRRPPTAARMMMRREVLAIEEAFEQHVRVCARPEMHYYYYH